MALPGDTNSNRLETHAEAGTGGRQGPSDEGAQAPDQQLAQERDPQRDLGQFATILAVGCARLLLRRPDDPDHGEAHRIVGGAEEATRP